MPNPRSSAFRPSNPGRVADKTKNYLIIVRPDSRNIAIEEIVEPPPVARLQELVEGFIELVPYFKTIWGRTCVAFCNEEGKLKGMAPNAAAQYLWVAAIGGQPGDHLCGPIVILAGTRAFLDKL
jgi:hypothetical protein